MFQALGRLRRGGRHEGRKRGAGGGEEIEADGRGKEAREGGGSKRFQLLTRARSCSQSASCAD
eukprot:746338-Hanusia_phi.AAC.1